MRDNESRILKVYEGYQREKKCPMIRLQGDWLRAYGFLIGDRFEVLFGFDESLILKKKDNEILSTIP